MKKIFLATAGYLLVAALISPLISLAITVGPSKLEYTLAPGASVTGNIFLLNEGSETQIFHPSFESFTEVNGEKQFFVGQKSDLEDWFTVPSSVTLSAGKSENIPFTLSVPLGAPPGGHFAVMWWNSAPAGAGAGTTAIVTRAGILVYLNVTGDVTESASISNFSPVGGGRFFSLFPKNFEISLKNTGSDYIQPTGNIQIKNILGNIDESFAVNKNGDAKILPQSEKDLPVTIDSPQRTFGFGIYRASLYLKYGETDKELADSYTFIVISWQIIIPALLVLFLLIWIIGRGVKKYNQWIIRQAASTIKNNQAPPPPTSPAETKTSPKRKLKK